MLLSKEILFTWSRRNKKVLEIKGYVFTNYGDLVKVKIEEGLITTNKVDVKCDYCEDVYLKDYNKYLKNVGKDCCSKCIGKKRKENDQLHRRVYSTPSLDVTYVRKRFEELNHTPLFKDEEYKGNTSKLKCKCNETEEVIYVQFSNLQTTGKCSSCGMKSRKEKLKVDVKIVKKSFEDKGLTLLNPSSYKNKDAHMKFVCNKHKSAIQSSTFGNLRRTDVPCKFCRYEKSLTEITIRIRAKLSRWKAEILLKQNNKCIISNSFNCDVHHIYPLNKMIKDELKEVNVSLDSIVNDGIKSLHFVEKIVSLHTIENGIALDRELHSEFHSIYGKSSTKENLEEFIRNKE